MNSEDALADVLSRWTSAAVVTLDLAGRVTMANTGAERLFGITLDDAIGKSYETVFGPSLSSRLVALFLRSGRRALVAPQTIQARLANGTTLRLRASMGPINDAEG